MAWTTSNLITSMRNSQMFPDASEGSLSNSAFLQYATQELYLTIVPMIMSLREKYYETFEDFEYGPATATIPVPMRAIGAGVSTVQYYYGTRIYQLHPINPSDISTLEPSAQPQNFYFQNNSIVFYRPPSGSQGYIRLRWFQRPSELVEVAQSARVQGIDRDTGVITCTPPSTWVMGDLCDFIPQAAPKATPFGLDSQIIDISTSSITFSVIPDALAVGDYICLAGYTCIPEVPYELQNLLVQAACCSALTAIGDQANLAIAKASFNEYMQAAIKLLTPRDVLGFKKVVSGWSMF